MIWVACVWQISGISSVVGVAEWLRRQVVALEIEGSNPSVHPNPLSVVDVSLRELRYHQRPQAEQGEEAYHVGEGGEEDA